MVIGYHKKVFVPKSERIMKDILSRKISHLALKIEKQIETACTTAEKYIFEDQFHLFPPIFPSPLP